MEKSNTCYKNDELVYKILDNFILCPTCVSRQAEINYTKEDKNKSSKKNKNCFICHGFLSRISYIVSDIISKIKKYEFENWLLGVKLPTFMYENEDEVRSRFKIRGKNSIKTDFLDRLRKEVFIKIKKPQVFKRPDLVINLKINDNDSLDISIKPRPLVLVGRYVKRIPGIEQKNRNNEKNSKLETTLNYDKLNSKKQVSIEKIIQEKLSIFCIDKKKDEITIFWIGGEDKESLVVGKGRPFIAQIHNPKKRFLSINDNVHNKDKKQLRTKGISIFIDKILDRMPESKISFLNKIRIYVQCEESISKNEIAKLRILKEKEIITNYKSKQITKKIYSIKSKYLDSNRFVLTIVSDGGLFIKQFIGDISSLMKPNVSEILGKTCTCLKFDILDVDLVSIFI